MSDIQPDPYIDQMAAEHRQEFEPDDRYCPEGCGCRYGTEDADARECGCDGPCTEGGGAWYGSTT